MSWQVEQSSIDLDLLGVAYRLSSNSARWLRFMRQLWEPFLAELVQPSFAIDIEESVSGIDLRLPGLDPLLLEDPWAVANAIKHSLVDHALQSATGVVAIHAALVEKAGARVLLVGASGAGKTTLCLELLDRGWRYGSDDVAPVVAGDGRVVAFPRALAVRETQVWDRYVGSWKPPRWVPRPVADFQLPPSIFALMRRVPCRPTHLFFIDPDHSSTKEPSPLSRGLAITQLSQYVRWVGDPDLRSVVKLGRSAEALTLRYRDPVEGGDLVSAACFD